ncbi:MAG: hypothetical protein JSV23_00200 [Promethearchaeota archaeon]|nr:MAG: hypothetical protein JSV23_00200 [Candidatus Lokiarchaeota archaeon]
MKESKYRKSLIIFCVYCIFWLGMSVAISILVDQNLTPLIPFSDPGMEVGMISILLLPVSSIIGMLIGGYLFGPLFLYSHIKIFRNRYEYGIHIKPEYKKFKFASQGLFTALMAINISLLLLNPDTVRIVLWNFTEPLDANDYMIAFVVILILTTAITNLLFSPTWFLMDSGITYSNKKNLEETNKPLEIRSIGRWYEQFLKGYAGVSVLISYVEFITIFFIEIGGELALLIVTLIMFIPFPIIMIVPNIPALIILDRIKEKRNKYILNKARKRGITDTMEVLIDLKKED